MFLAVLLHFGRSCFGFRWVLIFHTSAGVHQQSLLVLFLSPLQLLIRVCFVFMSFLDRAGSLLSSLIHTHTHVGACSMWIGFTAFLSLSRLFLTGLAIGSPQTGSLVDSCVIYTFFQQSSVYARGEWERQSREAINTNPAQAQNVVFFFCESTAWVFLASLNPLAERYSGKPDSEEEIFSDIYIFTSKLRYETVISAYVSWLTAPPAFPFKTGLSQ